MPRAVKRAFIIFIYLLIFTLIGSWIYVSMRPAPTCFDGQQNQGEGGIDCGGPCVQQCTVEIITEDLIINEKTVVAAGEESIDAVFSLRNPNSRYGAQSLSYTITLLDAAGTVVSQRSGTNYILPSEEKYIVELGMPLSQSPSRMVVRISDVVWTAFVEFEKPQLTISQKRFSLISSGTGFAEVFALVRNDSPFDFRRVMISVILKDAQGRTLALQKTEMNDLDAFAQREFTLNVPRFEGVVDDVRGVIVVAEANVFDSENFVKKFIPGGLFQQLQQ